MKSVSVMIMTLLAVLQALPAAAQTTTSANKPHLIVVGNGSISKVSPFGGVPYQDRYQQVYYQSAFPDRPVLIKSVAFTSDPSQGNSLTTSVVIRLSSAAGISTDFDANLDSDVKVVFDGEVTANLDGTPADLRFKTKPFLYNPAAGQPLLLDVQIRSLFGGGAFRAGPSGYTTRIYRNSGDGTVAIDNVGLLTIFKVAQ